MRLLLPIAWSLSYFVAAVIQVIPHPVAPRVDVLAHDKPFTTYLYLTSMTRPALVPIRTAAGTVVTRAEDPALASGGRVGLWFTHGNVNGVDFADDTISPRAGRIVHRRVVEAMSSDTHGQLAVQTAWTAPDRSVLLSEDTFFTFRESQAMRVIDRVTRLAAIGNAVKLGRTENGQIGIQLADGFRPREASRGAGRWLAVPGTVDGKAVAIALIEHPHNPGFPNLMRCVGGVLEIAPSGETSINASESVTYRYRVVLLDGRLDEPSLDAAYRDFTR
jgi:hypothetical protein